MHRSPCAARLEEGAVGAAGDLCAQLAPLADKLGEGSERAYAAGVSAVHAIARDTGDGDELLDDAITRLERIDARFLVPDLLGLAAERLYRQENLDRAQQRAASARDVADDVARPFESARAHGLLACIAAVRGDVDGSRYELRLLSPAEGSLAGHVTELRNEAER